MTIRSTYGLVLAGGESRRMGRDKALLPRDGKTQLEHVVSVLAKCVDRVFVSTRASQQDDLTRRQFEQIVDRYDDIGPIAGILSAIDEHPNVDWLVIACDLPNVDGKAIRKLLSVDPSEHHFVAYVSSHDGLPEPLCAVYRSGCGAVVRQFVDDGIVCPRKVLIRSKTHLLEQTDPASLDNVNSPADLAGSALGRTA